MGSVLRLNAPPEFSTALSFTAIDMGIEFFHHLSELYRTAILALLISTIT